MPIRIFAAALIVGLLPLVGRAADDDNPYRNVKVGDFANYKMTMKVAGQTLEGTINQTIIAKSDKEVSMKVTGKIRGMDIPEQIQKIDLTKPFDPTMANVPGGKADVKIEKGKEGKEKLKVGNKEYATTWTDYKVKGKAMGLDIDSDIKVWLAKDVTGALVKMEMKTAVAGQKNEMTMELTETGSKK